jgi:hypothetical protein
LSPLQLRVLKKLGPMRGTEFHPLKDSALVRVPGKLEDSEARAFESAFTE